MKLRRKPNGKIVSIDDQGNEQPVEFESIGADQFGNAEQAPTTDITSEEIQAKLDSYGNLGGPVQFGPGNHSGLGTISLGDGGKLQGVGIESTTLTAADGLNDNLVEYVNGVSKDWFFPEVKDLVLDGNDENNTSGHGLYTEKVDGDANDLFVSDMMIVSCAGDGLHAQYSWGYRLNNILLEHNQGRGLHIQGGSQDYLTDIFLQANGSDGGYIKSRQARVKGIRANSNGGRGIIQAGFDNSFTNIMCKGNDQEGFDARQPCTISGFVGVDNGQNAGLTVEESALRFRDDSDGSVVSDVYINDRAAAQDRGIHVSGGASNIQLSNVYCENNATYGVLTQANRTHISNVTCVNNGLRGINVAGDDVVIQNAYLSGNSGADLFVGGADTRLWNVQAGSIDVSSATRPRWDGVIYGGPLGGTDIGSLTGANEGDIARADGTNGSAVADELFILKSSGDWQSIADPTTTIAPS